MANDSIMITILSTAFASGIFTAILSKLLDILYMYLKQKHNEKSIYRGKKKIFASVICMKNKKHISKR